MECNNTLKLLNAYLDDCLSWEEAAIVGQHLQVCSHCAHEHHQLKSLRQVIRSLKPLEPPRDLSLRMKIEASKQDQSFRLEKTLSKVHNFLYPIAIPAFSGVALTFLFFVILLNTFFPGAHLTASNKDIPLSFFTPPRAQSLRMSQLVQWENFRSVKEPITVETYVDNNGRVVDYKILDGPRDRDTIRSLDQFFFFEVFFDPATSFGRPTNGKLVLSFNKIDVMG